MFQVIAESHVAVEVGEPGLLRLEVFRRVGRVEGEEQRVVPPVVVRVDKGQEVGCVEQNLRRRGRRRECEVVGNAFNVVG